MATKRIEESRNGTSDQKSAAITRPPILEQMLSHVVTTYPPVRISLSDSSMAGVWIQRIGLSSENASPSSGPRLNFPILIPTLQMVGHAGDDDVWFEEQCPLEHERALVV